MSKRLRRQLLKADYYQRNNKYYYPKGVARINRRIIFASLMLLTWLLFELKEIYKRMKDITPAKLKAYYQRRVASYSNRKVKIALIERHPVILKAWGKANVRRMVKAGINKCDRLIEVFEKRLDELKTNGNANNTH